MLNSHRKRIHLLILAMASLAPAIARAAVADELPFRWDELTAQDWPRALEKSARTIIFPIGILEKHGPHAALGSDLIHAREWAARVAKREYAVVFPDYFYGQINEARNQPGTFALPARVVWEMLEATCDEMGRNGFKKILIVNGHGGNPDLLRYFAQTQLERRRDYVVYFYDPEVDAATMSQAAKIRRSNAADDMHAGERETSTLMYLRPDLVKLDRAKKESGANLHRLSIPDVFTAIGWYASFPNHYAGEGDKATLQLGELLTQQRLDSLTKTLKAVKADTVGPKLQREFFDHVLR